MKADNISKVQAIIDLLYEDRYKKKLTKVGFKTIKKSASVLGLDERETVELLEYLDYGYFLREENRKNEMK